MSQSVCYPRNLLRPAYRPDACRLVLNEDAEGAMPQPMPCGRVHPPRCLAFPLYANVDATGGRRVALSSVFYGVMHFIHVSAVGCGPVHSAVPRSALCRYPALHAER